VKSMKIVVAMASFPARKKGMLRVVNELLPQCDKLCLYLNGYDRSPSELPKSDKLEVICAGPDTDNPDKGSQGKHHWLDVYGDSYYLTVDDDIFYPSDYVVRLIAAIERYSRKAIITAHGGIYTLDAKGYIPKDGMVRKHRKTLPYDVFVKEDTYVHTCGNACTGMCPSEIGLTGKISKGEINSGDDEDMAIFAQSKHIPIIRLATAAHWLQADEEMWPICAMHKDPECVALQSKKIKSWQEPWKLFPAIIQPKCQIDNSLKHPVPLVTVSMTTFNTPDHMLKRAVTSVLNQTEKALCLIVVNDNGDRSCWDELDDINDSRLTRLDMPVNRGTYACHAETLRRCKTIWWSPHDSDDYVLADRYEKLLSSIGNAKVDVLLGGYTNITMNGVKTPMTEIDKVQTSKTAPWIRHIAVWTGGLWRTEWLRKAGGINGTYRTSYDSVLITLALRFANIYTINDVGYMRIRHPSSLTMNECTGMGSAYRTQVLNHLNMVFAQIPQDISLDDAGELLKNARFGKTKTIANIISFNSAPELPALLQSLESGKIDALVAVDGGSSDGTLDILNAWEKRNPNIKVVTHTEPWKDDFAHQRNICLSITRKMLHDTDEKDKEVWVLMIDTDDTLSAFDRPYLEGVIQNSNVVALLVNMDNGNAPYKAIQFFKLTEESEWCNPIHEYIKYNGEKKEVPLEKLSIKRGRSKQHNDDPLRNVRIGHVFVEKCPADRRARFYLARDLFECGIIPHEQRMAEAEGHLRVYMSLPGSYIEQERLAKLLLCRIMWDSGRLEEARKYMFDTLMNDPDNRSAYEALANMESDEIKHCVWQRLAQLAQGRCVFSHTSKLPQKHT